MSAPAVEGVNTAMKDKLSMAEESKGSTQQQNDIMREAKIWRRAVVSRATRAQRLGKTVPAALLKADKGQSVPETAAQIEGMVRMLETIAGDLGDNIQDIIDEGKALAQSIKAIDADQEVKRLKSLPDAVRKFYFQKGLLFIGIKVVNDAGRELHAADAANSAKYNLSILYRHAGKSKPQAKTGA